MREEFISSAQNPKIKFLLELQEKSKSRKKSGLFVVEGCRELLHCLRAGYKADTIFFCPELFGTKTEQPQIMELADDSAKFIEIPRQIYDKVAYRGGTEGVIAEMETRECSLAELKLSKQPLIVVLESVEKPGNLGAVIRSADASGADAVIVCDPLTDLFNPNLIRSSIGGIFGTQCVACDGEEAIKWLKNNNIQILTAQLQDSEWYYDTDMTKGTAIVIGTEATGLTDIWRNAADKHIKIPMLGKLDSLNASVSAAILLFEAVRQRKCK